MINCASRWCHSHALFNLVDDSSTLTIPLCHFLKSESLNINYRCTNHSYQFQLYPHQTPFSFPTFGTTQSHHISSYRCKSTPIDLPLLMSFLCYMRWRYKVLIAIRMKSISWRWVQSRWPSQWIWIEKLKN